MSEETDLTIARLWLDGHGLSDVASTRLLAARLAVRRRARLGAAILPATFLIAVALVYVSSLPIGAADDELGSLLVLTGLVIALVVALSLLDGWVRRVDRRTGATLRRRAAHPVRPGWRSVLGLPRAALLVVTFVAAAVLAIGSLIVRDSASRFGAVVLLIGLCGVAVGTAVQLRHVLTYPVVADDEGSLTVDHLIRVEDAREVSVPTVVWSLPVVSVFDAGLDAWNTAWLVFIVASVVALALITVATARNALATQRATTGAAG